MGTGSSSLFPKAREASKRDGLDTAIWALEGQVAATNCGSLVIASTAVEGGRLALVVPNIGFGNIAATNRGETIVLNFRA